MWRKRWVDDDGAVEEQRASARLGVEALHKLGYVTGLHLLRFQTGGDRACLTGCASGVRPSETCSIYITPQFDCQSLRIKNIELRQKIWSRRRRAREIYLPPSPFHPSCQPLNAALIAVIWPVSSRGPERSGDGRDSIRDRPWRPGNHDRRPTSRSRASAHAASSPSSGGVASPR
jgi:hypothetical protein